MRGFRQISTHRRKCHVCHRICTWSPLRAALPHDSQKTRNTKRLRCRACHEKRSAAPATKHAQYLLTTSQNYCPCQPKRLSTRYQTHLNATKCHACFAKLSYMMRKTSNNGPSCSAYHRHGHTVLTTPVANGCEWLHTLAINRERLRTVANGCRRMRMVARR